MKFKIALLSLLASGSTAFSPRGFVPPTTQSKTDVWRPPMNMVAGGAEKAYGEEYYDGEEAIIIILCREL